MEGEIDAILEELGISSTSKTTSLHEDFENTHRILLGVPDVTEFELIQALNDLTDDDDDDDDDDDVVEDKEKASSLCRAAASGDLSLVNRMLKDGADPNEISKSSDDSTMNPICAAAASGENLIVQTLLEHGADPYLITMPHGNTCLHYASRLNRVEVVKELLLRGVQSLPNHAGLTPLADHLLHCGDDTEIYHMLADASALKIKSCSSSSSSSKHKTITRGELRIDLSKCLSSVGHSTSPVYVGTHVPTKRDVAVKIVPVHLWDEVSAEIRAISKLKANPRLSHIVHVEKCSMNTLIATPLCNAGDLSQASSKLFKRKDFMSVVAPTLCRHVTEGLLCLHKARFAHRDLKPSNILIHLDPRDGVGVSARLADFGYAIPLGTSTDFLRLRRVVSGQHGTTGFKPYELLRAMRSSGGIVMNNAALIRADVFGLGCVLFFILSKGNHPFGNDQMARDEKILKRSRILWWKNVSDSTKTLLTSTLLHDSEKRASTEDVLKMIIVKMF